MKFIIVFLVLIGSVMLWNYAKPEPEIKTTSKSISPSPSASIISQDNIKQYIFVPYWTFNKSFVTDSEFSLIYFGLGVDKDGIDLKDKGYQNLELFTAKTPNAKEKILTVRMVDKNINAMILKDLKVQEEIANEAIRLALDNRFNGVLLDYETSAFGFDSTTKNITNFYSIFSEKTNKANVSFYVTLYGDTYFRARPYDVKKIGRLSDKVFVMAYDFSKSRGNPGPNFPLHDNGIFGYDFVKMVEDFQKDVDNKKIVITLGYFGYDWMTNSKGEAVSNGIPLSTNEITKEFIENCKFENCKLSRLKGSLEPYINYTDEKDIKHVIWFEDTVSAQKKIDFLKSKGILEIADWAYSYY